MADFCVLTVHFRVSQGVSDSGNKGEERMTFGQVRTATVATVFLPTFSSSAQRVS